MADDFKVGDACICIAEPNGEVGVSWEPKVGRAYRIAGVGLCEDGSLGVDLKEDPDCFCSEGLWDASAFRKLPPADDAFVLRMREMKPRAPNTVREKEKEDV